MQMIWFLNENITAACEKYTSLWYSGSSAGHELDCHVIKFFDHASTKFISQWVSKIAIITYILENIWERQMVKNHKYNGGFFSRQNTIILTPW